VFSPFTIAKQLYGPDIVEHARDNSRQVEQGLEIIADTAARFAQDALAAGADGIFFATQFARHDLMSELEYRQYGLEYDLPVLDAVRDTADILVLHMCGPTPMFHFVPKYEVDIVNWEDRETPPSLHEGWERFADGAVLGGIRRQSLASGTPEDIEAEARWAVQHTDGGRRLILGTGCVTLVTAPDENIRAARQAAEVLPEPSPA
jgi:uroporphyrinogen decarboxylase